MSKKALVIILLALLLVSLLYVTSIRLASRGSANGPQINLTAPGPARVAAWLSRPAQASYLTPLPGSAPGCRVENGQIILQPNETCNFAISADKTWTRKLRLALPFKVNSSASLTVSLEQPDALRIEQTLVPGVTPDALDIYGRQDQQPAHLQIRAPNATPADPIGYVIDVVSK